MVIGSLWHGVEKMPILVGLLLLFDYLRLGLFRKRPQLRFDAYPLVVNIYTRYSSLHSERLQAVASHNADLSER